MSDFLDRFGDQLAAAERRAKSAPEAAHAPFASRFVRRHRLALVAVGATLAVAAPAAAILAPWRPSLERADIDQPVATSTAPVSRSAVDAFGVLRRPQTSADRSRTAPLLHVVGAGNQVDDVQTDGIRSVADGWALVPAKAVRTSPAGKAQTDVLCLTNGTQIGCSPTSSAVTKGLGLVSASPTRTSIAGLVPDEVTAVRFTPAGGRAVEVPVASNFFSLDVSQTAPPRTIKAPPGYEGAKEIPAPPTPVSGTLQWLDGNGNVVGPAQQAIGG